MITVSQKAAEQILKVQTESGAAGKNLRIAIAGSGCGGPQYQLGFDTQGEGDARFDSNGISVLVDPNSLTQLTGSEIDFADGAYGPSFVVNNPNAPKSCGCGKSGC
ncbi:MAG: iron-sulfur cluster assembly accessory protein [Nitrospinae bacterium]|nr:iron-sulfur cluster assembly accessory protein [Nitrospinota bacterium]